MIEVQDCGVLWEGASAVELAFAQVGLRDEVGSGFAACTTGRRLAIRRQLSGVRMGVQDKREDCLR